MKLIAGPCVVENRETPIRIASEVKQICTDLDIELIFKASYRKANRTRPDAFTSIGVEESLNILAEIKREFEVPVLTDIHETYEVAAVAEVVDVLQIPAFLCRQTDLLVEAGKSGKAVNIKKGQFAGPDAMKFAIEKVKHGGDVDVWLTERGTTFGYQDLVVDMRNIPKMQAFGVPVILDVTHSLQQPNRADGTTGGDPAMIETIARAGIAAGADGLFLEVHPNPSESPSDAANMLQLDRLRPILITCKKIFDLIHS